MQRHPFGRIRFVHRFIIPALVSIPLLLAGPAAVGAQDVLEALEDAASWTVSNVDIIPRAGMAAVLSPAYCGGLTGWRAGLEARSRGQVHFGLSYDLLYDFDATCRLPGYGSSASSPRDTITAVEDGFAYDAMERIVVWVGGGLDLGVGPASVTLGFGHAQAPWWSGDWDNGPAGWWVGAQAGVMLGNVLHLEAEVGGLRTAAREVTFEVLGSGRRYLDQVELGDRWRATFTASAALAGGSLPVRADHGDLILAARTGSFAKGNAVEGCTAGGPGWMKGVEARTVGTLFGAISVDLLRAPGDHESTRCQVIPDSVGLPPGTESWIGGNGQSMYYIPRLGLHAGVTTPPFPVRILARIGGGMTVSMAWKEDSWLPWAAGSLEAIFLEYLTVGYERGWMRPALDDGFVDNVVNGLMGGAEIKDWVNTERFWIGLQIGLSRDSRDE